MSISIVILSCLGGILLGVVLVGWRLGGMYTQRQAVFVETEQTLQSNIHQLENELVRLQTELEGQKRRFDEKQDTVTHLQQAFENLSNKIFSNHANTFRSNTQDMLGTILTPLKERIKEFESKVDDQFEKKVRDITSLKVQIQHMMSSNQEITKAAQDLTSALKGDAKIQGNWGELVLTRVLEASGLRAGHEYTLQGEGMQIKGEEGQHLKPDVIIHLPDDKHIIIDSKVSLTNYEALLSTDNVEEQDTQQARFMASIKNHIDGLSKKKYHHSDQLITPEFVLLFMPIEGAFALALQTNQKMYGYAWNKGIVLVSPTTLLATLRTIESLWKMERQNQNAIEIARQAGALYDKFVGFASDLDDIGKNIDRTHTSYEKALNKLSAGKGNLVSRVENLKTMGAKTSKSLPTNERKALETPSPTTSPTV